MRKSTPAEIEARFDADVERFSDLATGQATIPDSALAQDLLVAVAARHSASPVSLLDLGCGAGNLTLRLLAGFERPPERVRLIDLS
ncbi:class I SAM-dependent methyltransferase, partial [bacterium]